MKKIVIAAVAAVAALSLSACDGLDKMQEQYKDAPIGPRVNEPVTIVEMPDGYANIATVCVDGMRYSSATTGSSNDTRAISVVPDPTCK